MEVEAESITYAICRANGLSTKIGDASGTYIAQWAKAAGPDVVKKRAQKVSSVVKQILGEGSWQNMPGNEGREKRRMSKRSPSWSPRRAGATPSPQSPTPREGPRRERPPIQG